MQTPTSDAPTLRNQRRASRGFSLVKKRRSDCPLVIAPRGPLSPMELSDPLELREPILVKLSGGQNVLPNRTRYRTSAHASWLHRGKRRGSEPNCPHDVLRRRRRRQYRYTNSGRTIIGRCRQFVDQAHPAGHCRRSDLVAEFGPMRNFVARGGW